MPGGLKVVICVVFCGAQVGSAWQSLMISSNVTNWFAPLMMLFGSTMNWIWMMSPALAPGSAPAGTLSSTCPFDDAHVVVSVSEAVPVVTESVNGATEPQSKIGR